MKKFGVCLLLAVFLVGCVRSTRGPGGIPRVAATASPNASALDVPVRLPTLPPTAAPSSTPTPDPNLVQDFSAHHVWSPSGNEIAVGSQTGLRIYDTASLELKKTLLTSELCCGDLQYRESRLGAIYRRGSQLEVWDLGTERSLFSLTEKDTELQSLAISPDEKLLAVGGKKFLRVYQLEDGKLLFTLPVEGFVSNLAFNPQGTVLIASTQWNSAVLEWDLQSQQLIGFYNFPRDVFFFTFSPDASMMMVDYGDAGLEMWSLGMISSQYYYSQILGAPGFTSIGHANSRVAVWGYMFGGESAAGVWDLYQGAQVREFVKGGQNNGEWKFASFSPDDKTLALSDDRGRLILYDVESGAEIARLILPFQFSRE